MVASGAIIGAFLVFSSAVWPRTLSPRRSSNEEPEFSTLSSTLLTDPTTVSIADSKVSWPNGKYQGMESNDEH
ncbi:hypothetical protein EDB86DRAFT_2888686 [Lactarius hatsudake]|nr:hypothetical protein EDB86DRAFT_2888686 [Lactarius hatsudake]